MNDGYEDSLAADRDVDRVREEKARREAREARTATDIYLAIERSLTAPQRAVFLGKMIERDRRWDGAKVADVLSILDDSDAFLGEIEEAFPEEAPDDPRRLRVALYVTIVLLGVPDLEWAGMIAARSAV